MRFSLEVHHRSEEVRGFADELVRTIKAAGSEVVDSDEESPDLVIAVGGDGTMLAATQKALAHDVPILGFNLGTVGFLAEVEPEEVADVIDRLVAGRYQVAERMTVAATVRGVATTGVNDVIVEKVDSGRLIHLAVSIDGEDFLTYRADGLIVSTPTGSTAYSFSAGGPLVHPGLEALILTPVAAHSLFDRTLVFPAETVIEVEVARDRPVKVTVDKVDLGHLAEGDRVRIEKGGRPARFVTFSRRSFPRLLTEKFGLS